MSANTVSAEPLRAAMVDRLRQMGAIRRDEVAAAFLRVPRHLFAPEATSLEEAYDVEAVIRTKWARDGTAISSVSAPQIQARMVEQAGIRNGMNVLELGSGGCNAAVMAELVGPEGQVTTVDIDAEVTARAGRLLEETGYARVNVVLGDGELGCPSFAPFDAIVVTVEAADVPPAWIEQLVEGGSLVAPLRIRGFTRSLGFTKLDGRLVSTSKELCGFVPMRGRGEWPRREVALREGTVRLRFDEDPCPAEPDVLEHAFEVGRAHVWTEVTVQPQESIDTLQTWLATTARGSCLLAIDGQDEELAEVLGKPAIPSMCNAVVDDDSFAYLTMRKPNQDTVELGTHAFGPNASALATMLADLVREWDRDHRHGPGPQYTICPANTDDQLPEGAVVTKRHVKITVAWPAPPRRPRT